MSSLADRITARGLVPQQSGAPSGGGTVVSGGVTLDTVAALNAATIDPAVNYVRVAGYWEIGDDGAGAYRRKAVIELNVDGDQTSNGGTVRWEIILENNEISVFRFGAHNMFQFNVEPAPGAQDDSYAAFLKADKFFYAKQIYGATLHVGHSFLYLSKPHNLKRVNYVIKGNLYGCFIRTPAYSDGICINYAWGTGPDYSLALNNFTYNAGQALWKQTGKAGEGNTYRCYVTGLSGLSDDPLTGTDPNATYTWGTAQFKFERYIGPSGPNPYDWDVGGSNTAANSRIEDIRFWSFWDMTSSDPNVNKWPDQHGKPGNGQFNCAIIERVRARLNNIFCFQYPGHNIAIVADGDPDVTGPGNVNGFHNDHIFSYYAGKSGLHIGYSDANAGTTIYLDTSSCGRFGYEEFSFLGNLCAMHQSAFDGRVGTASKQYPSGCTHNGFYWNARLPLLGVQNWPAYINEEPGVATNAWTAWGGGGTAAPGSGGAEYPDWTNTQRFEPGGGFGSNNVNARNVFVSMYVEGGTFTSQPGSNDVVLGGLTQNVDLSRGAAVLSNNSWSRLETSGGINFNQDNLKMNETNGIPTTPGVNYEIRWNRAGGAGVPMGWQYISGTWRPLANRL